MITKSTSLLDAIKQQSAQLPIMDEKYYKNNLPYKPFNFKENQLEKTADMFAKIEYTLVNHQLKYYLLMDKKLIEAQDALIKACDEIYSERIRYNTELTRLVELTILPYYHSRFQMGFSREISFLPLELRLYIYTRLLAVEASTIRQMHLVDRIALTLHKSGEHFLGDCAIFISAWLKSKLSPQLTGKKQTIGTTLAMERKTIQQAASLRKQILSEAEMTPEKAWEEFWYGIKSFSSLQNIHNLEAAKICLELFAKYYQKSYHLVNDIQPILKEYYETKNPARINQFIQKIALDSISIVNRYTQASYSTQEIIAMTPEKIEELNLQQKRYTQQILNKQKENTYQFLNPDSSEVRETDLKLPEVISEQDAAQYLNKLADILSKNKIALSQFNQHLLYLTTAMISEGNWNIKKLNVVIGALGELYSIVWLRNRGQDSTALVQALIDIIEEKPNVFQIGKGWPVGLVLQEGNHKNRTCVVFHSKNANFPEFIGHFYIGDNPASYTHLAFEKIFLESRSLRIYWNRIEKYLDAPKSIRKKHAAFWKKLQQEKGDELSQG